MKNYRNHLNFFIEDIKKERGGMEGRVHSISYYHDGKNLIGRDMAKEVARRTEDAMNFVSKTNDFFCYAWLDAQAGQLRFSTKKDPNIEDAFRAKVIRVDNLICLINDIYIWENEWLSPDEDNYDADEIDCDESDQEINMSVKVFVVEP